MLENWNSEEKTIQQLWTAGKGEVVNFQKINEHNIGEILGQSSTAKTKERNGNHLAMQSNKPFSEIPGATKIDRFSIKIQTFSLTSYLCQDNQIFFQSLTIINWAAAQQIDINFNILSKDINSLWPLGMVGFSNR